MLFKPLSLKPLYKNHITVLLVVGIAASVISVYGENMGPEGGDVKDSASETKCAPGCCVISKISGGVKQFAPSKNYHFATNKEKVQRHVNK